MRDIRPDVIFVILITLAITIFAVNSTTEFGPLATGSIGVTAETVVEWGQPPSGEVLVEDGAGEVTPDATEEAADVEDEAGEAGETETAEPDAEDVTDEAPTEEADSA